MEDSGKDASEKDIGRGLVSKRHNPRGQMFAVSDHRHTYYALVIYHVLHLQRKERRGEHGGGVVGCRGNPS